MTVTSSAASEVLLENARAPGRDGRAIWHKSAPARVRRAFRRGDVAAGWTAWKRQLARRTRPIDPDELLPGKRPALNWALPEGIGTVPAPSTMAAEEELAAWMADSAGSGVDVEFALGALAWCRALPRLAEVLPTAAWWQLLDNLLATAADAGRLELEDPSCPQAPLIHQLLAGELALTLAYLLPEITPCRKLARPGRRALSAGLVDLLDGNGLPHARYFDLLRPLLACWTRCRAIGQRLRGGCWSKAAEWQYHWLIHQGLRFTRRDGSHVLCDGSAASRSADLFDAALCFSDDQDDQAIAAAVLPRKKKKAGKSRQRRVILAKPALHSPWAAAALLRPEWSPSAPRLTVLYGGQSVRMELGCGRDVLWSGVWELDVSLDGEPATPDCDWEEVCWVSDDDADYLELQIELTGRFRVQRQILLARRHRFLLLADVILGTRPGTLQYRGRLPLGKEISFDPAGETREGFLVGKKGRASVLPLALPEWRSDRRIGELTPTAQGLELAETVRARRLYAPLFVDLDRRRITRPLTWRQLTVAESLAAQPPEVAVGYRVATGNRQWLIYRSLAEKANRTLLGHNLSTEMLVAKFDRCGEVHPLVEIE